MQHILSTITGIDGLEIISCETQRDMSQLIGARYHSSVLDEMKEEYVGYGMRRGLRQINTRWTRLRESVVFPRER